jgi:hypothetical protein
MLAIRRDLALSLKKKFFLKVSLEKLLAKQQQATE